MKSYSYKLSEFLGISSLASIFCVLVLTSCSEKAEEEILYFPYDPTATEKNWMPLEKAMEGYKYDFLIEVSKFVGKKQTIEQKKLADKLSQNTLKNAMERGWGDIERAVADGYVYEPERDLTHLTNYEYLFDDEVLNPLKPEFLMYFNSEHGPILAGVAYMLADIYEHGPQIGGQETVWHFHSYPPACVVSPYPPGHKSAKKLKQGSCENGKVFVDRSPEMLHVWFVNHPQGRFASLMSIDESLLYDSPFAKLVNPSQSVMSKDQILKGALRPHHHH